MDFETGRRERARLAAELLKRDPELEIVVLHGYASIETAVEADAVRAAVDYISVSRSNRSCAKSSRRKTSGARGGTESLLSGDASSIALKLRTAGKRRSRSRSRPQRRRRRFCCWRERHRARRFSPRAIHQTAAQKENAFVNRHCPSRRASSWRANCSAHVKGRVHRRQSATPRARWQWPTGGTLFLD